MNRFLLALCHVFSFFLAQSQANGTLKGFLYEKGTGEAVPFANVFLRGTNIGGNTDLNGFLALTASPREIIPSSLPVWISILSAKR
jgi:hypothetical protein